MYQFEKPSNAPQQVSCPDAFQLRSQPKFSIGFAKPWSTVNTSEDQNLSTWLLNETLRSAWPKSPETSDQNVPKLLASMTESIVRRTVYNSKQTVGTCTFMIQEDLQTKTYAWAVTRFFRAPRGLQKLQSLQLLRRGLWSLHRELRVGHMLWEVLSNCVPKSVVNMVFQSKTMWCPPTSSSYLPRDKGDNRAWCWPVLQVVAELLKCLMGDNPFIIEGTANSGNALNKPTIEGT